MKTPLLLWFIVWTPPLSFFPGLNLICSGQAAAYKQSTHSRLMMQGQTVTAFCVHIFGNLLLVACTCNTAVVRFSQADKDREVLFCILCRAVGADEKALGGVCGCDGKGKCQCIHRIHTHIHKHSRIHNTGPHPQSQMQHKQYKAWQQTFECNVSQPGSHTKPK